MKQGPPNRKSPESPARPRRRRSRQWTAAQIAKVVKSGMIRFLPDAEVKTSIKTSKTLRAATEADANALPTGSGRKVLDAVLKSMERDHGSAFLWTEYLRMLVRDFASPGGAIDHKRALQLVEYAKRQLGLPKNLILPELTEPKAVALADDAEELRQREQLSEFTQWTKTTGLWHDPDWREAIELRYNPRYRNALDWIDPEVKRVLDEHVARHHDAKEQGDELYAKWGDAVFQTRHGPRYRRFRFQVCSTYINWKATGDSFSDDLLTEPVAQSHFFISEPTGNEGQPAFGPRLSPTPDAFMRYLVVPQDGQAERIGRLIYRLQQLEVAWGTCDPNDLAPGLKKNWPPTVSSSQLFEPVGEFRRLVGYYAEALSIDVKILTKIWAVYFSEKAKSTWQRRGPANATVFWAARILEEEDPTVYNAYRDWVDFFHDLLRGKSSSQVPYTRVEPFAGALRADPLLCCVFHSEVLNGRDYLIYRPGKRGPDLSVVNVTLAYADRLLKPHFLKGGIPKINDVLRGRDDIDPAVREVVGDHWADSFHAIDVGPRSQYAYLTPIAVTLFGDGDREFDPAIVKSRCWQYRDHPDVLAYLEDFTGASQRALRVI